MKIYGTAITGKGLVARWLDGKMVDDGLGPGTFVEDGSTGTSTSTGLRAARRGPIPTLAG